MAAASGSRAPERRVPGFFSILIALAAAGLLLAVWMVVVERRWFRVRRVVLSADELGLPPLRILHLTDTHFHGRDRAIVRFLAGLAEREEFDLVLFTGDLMDNPAGLAAAAEAAGLFRARLGAFAVLGAHDYVRVGPVRAYLRFFYKKSKFEDRVKPNPVDELARQLQAQGVRVLRDEHVDLAGPGGEAFALVGLQDTSVFAPDYRGAWDGLPADAPVLVMAHSPDVLSEVCLRRAALALFGHTHGGQVRFPFVGALVTRSSLPGRLASGTFRRDRTIVSVSSGLGTAPPTPYRLLCRPEAVVIELRREPPPEDLTRPMEARHG